MLLAAAGITLGLVGAFAAAGLLTSFLFGVTRPIFSHWGLSPLWFSLYRFSPVSFQPGGPPRLIRW